ncbi:MAG: Mrp/NBP35 family ATP-binding protein [Verrucomicrobiota bacterium]|jgi:ATP-binding protein involved in chromosome partitioning|nr:Mrp/NBP35 family ATP-binding protein [Verrucomicrobiota bacterium]MDP7050154.1 Mrp/NBP35 family ATP-binding protein [Verrucomicrobiota bacterium]
MPSENEILDALKAVKYPGYSRDIVSFGIVKDVAVANGAVSVAIHLTSANAEAAVQIKSDCEAAIKAVEGVRLAHVQVHQPPGGRQAQPGGTAPGQAPQKVPGIARVIAVASGKGGVGKSTVSVNLACALAKRGARIGLLDCDIYGPSIPLMMGVNERPSVTVGSEEKLVPLESHGVKLMSMGFLLQDDQPIIWRGPMIMRTIQQFVMQVDWGELDYLIVDLPPGTGDAQLSLCQTVPLDGGVIVTTPQEASLGVVRKGIEMFRKVNVPILGLVENMSYFTAPGGERVEIFGHGGGQDEATRQGAPFLGEMPLFTEIRKGGDDGVPVVLREPESPPAIVFGQIAQQLEEHLVDTQG